MSTTPPPRLVPDRPSDAAIAKAVREVAGLIQTEAFAYPSANSHTPRIIELCQRLELLSREIDAAAPPAEAPGERRPTHHVYRGPESLPCYCAGTSDHPIGQEDDAPAERGEALAELGSMEMALRHLLTAKQWTENAMRSRFDSIRQLLAAAPAAPAEGWDWFRECRRVLDDVATEMRATGRGDSRFVRLIETMPRAPRVTGGREAEFVVELLIEAGHVPRGRVSQARAIAKNAALQATTGGEIDSPRE